MSCESVAGSLLEEHVLLERMGASRSIGPCMLLHDVLWSTLLSAARGRAGPRGGCCWSFLSSSSVQASVCPFMGHMKRGLPFCFPHGERCKRTSKSARGERGSVVCLVRRATCSSSQASSTLLPPHQAFLPKPGQQGKNKHWEVLPPARDLCLSPAKVGRPIGLSLCPYHSQKDLPTRTRVSVWLRWNTACSGAQRRRVLFSKWPRKKEVASPWDVNAMGVRGEAAPPLRESGLIPSAICQALEARQRCMHGHVTTGCE